MKKVFWILLLLSAPIWSYGNWRAQLGGMDGFVERMGAGIRSLGMGNTSGADAEAGYSAFWNPALLAQDRGMRVDFSFEQLNLGRTGSALGMQSQIGNRMGIGGAILWRGVTDFQVIDEDDQDLGSANPYFYMGYLGLGWKLSRRDLLGFSFTKSGENYDLQDIYGGSVLPGSESPLSYNLGWFRQWSPKWQTGVVIRNLGFNTDLSARWTRSTSSDNSYPTSYALRPKSLEISQNYFTKLYGRELVMRLQVLDYQMADTLLVLDPDRHAWMARLGFEWMAWEGLNVRAGYDAGNYAAGASLLLRKNVWMHYALLWEGRAGLLSPMTIGFDARF